MKKFNVNPADYYPHLIDNPYPEFYQRGSGDSKFRQGDVVVDLENQCIGIVLGTIDEIGGYLRLDTDGMQPIKNLRHATIKDFKKYGCNDALFQECVEQNNS